MTIRTVPVHVVCPHCLREFDSVIEQDLGDDGQDEGIMLCTHCLCLTLVSIEAGQLSLRKPTAAEQRELDEDPVVRQIMKAARERRGPL